MQTSDAANEDMALIMTLTAPQARLAVPWLARVLPTIADLHVEFGESAPGGVSDPEAAAEPSQQGSRSFVANAPQTNRLRRMLQIADLQSNRAEHEQALETLAATLREFPSNRDALRMTASIAQGLGYRLAGKGDARGYDLLLESHDAMKQLSAERRDFDWMEQYLLNTSSYNAACIYARRKQFREALSCLRDSLDAGFQDLALLSTDPDMDELRPTKEFQELMVEARQTLDKRRSATVREALARHVPFAVPAKLVVGIGDTTSMDEFRGRTVLLHLGGIWCPTWRDDVPRMARLAEGLADHQVSVIGVHFDSGPAARSTERAREFARDHQVGYPIVSGGPDLADLPGVAGYPTTLIVDPSGHCRLAVEGNVQFEFLLTALGEILRNRSAGQAPEEPD